jgi:predicted RND superfamily exporter protein
MHRLTAVCVRHPWLTVIVALAAVFAAARGALDTELSVGLAATLGADDPVVREFEAFLDRFGGGYPVVIAYECSSPEICGGALDPAALDMAAAVAGQLRRAPVVSRVSSPATSPLLVPSPNLGLEVRRFVTDGVGSVDPELVRLAREDPLWHRTLLSADGTAGAIAVELASTEADALVSVMEEAEAAIAPFRASFTFHLVGDAVLWDAAHTGSVESMMRVGVGTGAMLFITLLLLLRSLPAVVASLATIGVASVCSLGTLPLLGWPLSELTSGAAAAILVIGCADCIHFAAQHLETRARFGGDAPSLVEAARQVAAPCFLTTATSAAAFASFGFEGIRSLLQFGVMAGIGVSLAFVLTFSLLPALLVLWPGHVRPRNHSHAWQEVLARLAEFGIRRRRLVLGAAFLLLLVGGIGLTKLRVELSFTELWEPNHPVRRALDFVSQHLQRPNRLEVQLELPGDARIEEPAILGEVAGLEERLARVDGIGDSRSVATLVLHANRLLHPERATSELPRSTLEVGELMTLVSSGDPSSLDTWITFDQRSLRVSAEVEDIETAERQRLLEEVDRLLASTLPAGWRFQVTGPIAVGTHWAIAFGRSQTAIVSTSIFFVFLLIWVYLRSFAWAVLAMIPNAVALVLLFGAMGHWGVPIDMGSAIVAPVAIGIAADDSIHFLTAYSRERRIGHEPLDALRRAIAGVGEAVIATATALALGFLSMLASPFPSISSLGFLTATAIVAATLADLLVLPALIAVAAARLRPPLSVALATTSRSSP